MGPVDETAAAIAHLYRRAGFGARPDELDAATTRGYEATVESLLAVSGPDPAADAVPVPHLSNPQASGGARGAGGASVAERQATQQALRQEDIQLARWWLQRMAVAANPFAEKLALFWHGHFATSVEKVRYSSLMYRQNQLFRSLGLGSFEDLTQAVAKDPAMLVWLDANSDKKGHPNENFARELMELFTLGLGNFAEDDVKEAARAFTGWTFDPASGQFRLRPFQHDDGQKTVLGQTGDLGGEDVIRVAVHQPASARFVVAKVWSHFAWPVLPDDPVVDSLLEAYGADLSLGRLLRAVFLHPQFTSPQARTGLVKQPVEYVVGTVRALRLSPGDPRLLQTLQQLGQVPFSPPNVGGWPQNGYWLTTASSYGRLRFATAAARAADLSTINAASTTARPEAAARLLSVDGWGPATTAALARVADDPASILSLALVAPEYVLA
ncbi:MAG: DUF1800 domain-containing protein [Acidimicrobiia bacterium]|nr:DUF1800 domain-containing protein [Acidimicrobiia bacterium]